MRKGNINNNSKDISEPKNNIDYMDDIDAMSVLPEDAENTENVIVDESVNSNQEEQNDKNKEKAKDKLKVIILIVVIVLLVGTTAGLLVCKYINVNKQDISNESGNITNSNNSTSSTVTGVKKETEDTKYLVSYTDMYTLNPISITDKLYEKEKTKKQGSIDISYIEISGLQDKELEEKINKEIKDNAYYYSDKTTTKQAYHSYTDVQGNFSNILSIHTYVYVYEDEEIVFDEDLYLNYNLATGEHLKFLDLFASNTPMNSIIYDLEYERLAWDTEMNFDMSEKEWDKATNMDKRDTSEYEDIILKVINRYKNLDKDEIDFYVTPNTIYVNLGVGEGGEEVPYAIDLYKYIDYVTLYKKFLTDDVVYENVPSDKLLVFNDMIGYIPEYYKIESDNLFISVFSDMDQEYMKEEEQAEIEKYSQDAVNMKNKLLEQHKNKILDEIRALAKKNKNKGYLARFMPYAALDDYDNEYGSETLIYICLDGAIEEMDIDYYKENAFKLLAKQNAAPKVSIDQVLIGRLAYDNDNVKSLLYNEDEENIVDLIGYYTLDGELVATSYEEVEEYLDNKYTEPEPEPEPEDVTEEQPEVDIYKEEE